MSHRVVAVTILLWFASVLVGSWREGEDVCPVNRELAAAGLWELEVVVTHPAGDRKRASTCVTSDLADPPLGHADAQANRKVSPEVPTRSADWKVTGKAQNDEAIEP